MRRLVARLARDRVSGATALARQAALLLRAVARDHRKPLARWQRDLRAAGRLIADAQPAMASLLNVADLAFHAGEAATDPRRGGRAVARVLGDYLSRQRRAVERAAARAARLVPPGGTCLTISSSETVCRALVAASRERRLARVLVAESRPGCEGVGLAARLAARRVPVALVVDALAPATIERVDIVLVGADAVTSTAVWNKCGTLSLALAARAARRPLVVVTTEDRLAAPALARRLRLPAAEPGAVLARPPRGVRVENRLFDVTPLGLVSRLVTESGTYSREAVRARLARRHPARWWRDVPPRGRRPRFR